MDFETYAMSSRPSRGSFATKSSSVPHEEMTLDQRVAYCTNTMLQASVLFHKLHLKVNGQGAYAAHMALGGLYDAIPGLIDGIVESYQGAAEVLLDFSIENEESEEKTLNSVEDAISYIRELYGKATMLQQIIPYSEVVNEIDNLKSVLNSTKYKLLFLK